jgi:hypothetical protein
MPAARPPTVCESMALPESSGQSRKPIIAIVFAVFKQSIDLFALIFRALHIIKLYIKCALTPAARPPTVCESMALPESSGQPRESIIAICVLK